MNKIGLISDTHSFLDDRVFTYFKDCDEVWHAGDIGDPYVLDQLEEFKPVRAVFGNIDNQSLRARIPEVQSFTIDGLKVFMIHIGGTPPRYAKGVKSQLLEERPQLFICGHSHILKVMPDQNLNKMLYMNPGAAGHHGFHRERTLLRFSINESKISDLEVIELGKRGRN
ncbi:metallophosphoesterase family protein [Roseivirga misakiensis]|uniref:Phosphoesterase n=1 Tax=Roseivirga misakiensis TaxID=1563681 RepID=A0A1E5SLH9_9BACT|nr:metallophosphoesterase family protein [Roseivirga misakiensis]OEJ99985.1 YfcE family phosphodiesterase [Roseivirga misakiensis]